MTKNNKIVVFPDREKLEAQAAAFIARLDHGDMNEQELLEIRRWSQSSPQHRAALERMAAIWGGADILEQLRDYPPLEEEPPVRKVNRRFLAAAAASILVVGVGISLIGSGDGGVYRSAFETALGEQREVPLPDGSVMTLNTDTLAQVIYSELAREIVLIRGEAYFDVAKDVERPFRVSAGNNVVEAVGTAFSVRLGEREEIEVTVAEGRVALAALEAASNQSHQVRQSILDEDKAMMDLAANQRAVFSGKVQSVESVEDAALDRSLAWRKGVLIFAGDRLEYVVAEITRYTDVEITIADEALANRSVGGYFRIGELEAMFRSLELGFGVVVERQGEKQILLRQQGEG